MAGYLSIDLAPGRAMCVMDLTALDLPDRDRDLVIAYHVLEHVPDDRKAMREIARVLKPGGRALLEVPLRGDETDEQYMDAGADVRALHYGQPDHVRMYGRSNFEARLLESGLIPTAFRVGDVLVDAAETGGLDRDEVFYVAVRSSP